MAPRRVLQEDGGDAQQVFFQATEAGLPGTGWRQEQRDSRNGEPEGLGHPVSDSVSADGGVERG